MLIGLRFCEVLNLLSETEEVVQEDTVPAHRKGFTELRLQVLLLFMAQSSDTLRDVRNGTCTSRYSLSSGTSHDDTKLQPV